MKSWHCSCNRENRECRRDETVVNVDIMETSLLLFVQAEQTRQQIANM